MTNYFDSCIIFIFAFILLRIYIVGSEANVFCCKDTDIVSKGNNEMRKRSSDVRKWRMRFSRVY